MATSNGELTASALASNKAKAEAIKAHLVGAHPAVVGDGSDLSVRVTRRGVLVTRRAWLGRLEKPRQEG